MASILIRLSDEQKEKLERAWRLAGARSMNQWGLDAMLAAADDQDAPNPDEQVFLAEMLDYWRATAKRPESRQALRILLRDLLEKK